MTEHLDPPIDTREVEALQAGRLVDPSPCKVHSDGQHRRDVCDGPCDCWRCECGAWMPREPKGRLVDPSPPVPDWLLGRLREALNEARITISVGHSVRAQIEAAMADIDFYRTMSARVDPSPLEEISVCKACGEEVFWHKVRLLYDCTNCGRIDGSAKLELRAARVDPSPLAQWQPIETAPKDGTMIIGALIVGPKIWRVHEMKHNGLAFYTAAGGSLPKMTHWIPMPALRAALLVPTPPTETKDDHGEK